MTTAAMSERLGARTRGANDDHHYDSDSRDHSDSRANTTSYTKILVLTIYNDDISTHTILYLLYLSIIVHH